MSDVEAADQVFERQRPNLMALAYRMTGSIAEAEDIVQDAFVRWRGAAHGTVRRPEAFLKKTVVHLCLDVLKSARMRRETYVGPWLPEPVLGEGAMSVDQATELAEDVSMALMMALERLSPAERAAFILHDVFDSSYTEVARTLGRSEAASRQLVARARAHVRAARPRYTPSLEEHQRVVRAFGAAVFAGDLEALREVLADDSVLYPDGGGRVVSALRPIHGDDRVARFLLGVLRKFPMTDSVRISEQTVNGAPGFVLEEHGRAVQTIAFDVRDGRVAAVYIVRNPDKLTRVLGS